MPEPLSRLSEISVLFFNSHGCDMPVSNIRPLYKWLFGGIVNWNASSIGMAFVRQYHIYVLQRRQPWHL